MRCKKWNFKSGDMLVLGIYVFMMGILEPAMKTLAQKVNVLSSAV